MVEGGHRHQRKVAVLRDLRQKVLVFADGKAFVETAAECNHPPVDQRRRPVTQRPAGHQRPIEWRCGNVLG